uniref:Uncharacterized protein n=1 Tax=Rhizophora mucronata TaxID=61149 RepID=A0A2P2K102_RHIMU
MGGCASRPEGCVSRRKKKRSRKRRRRIIKRPVSSVKIEKVECCGQTDRSFTNPTFQGLSFFIPSLCSNHLKQSDSSFMDRKH